MTMAGPAMPRTAQDHHTAGAAGGGPMAAARPLSSAIAPPGGLRPPVRPPVPVSATLAANEALDRKRAEGGAVLPLAFGEAGLPPHPALRAALAAASGGNAYGPVAGLPSLLDAAAGYWARRGLATGAGQVVAGPGSKALLFGLLMALAEDVALARPSWVSYAAQAALMGVHTHAIPTVRGEGGVPDPDALDRAARGARRAGRVIGSVIVTLPDNPTGGLASVDTVRGLAEVAAHHDLMIISDEIYRDLVHDPAQPFPSPAAWAPDRTVITTGLSKNLALGGWRLGVARLPDGPAGTDLRERLLGIGSEIWSAAAVPVQQAAALAFTEPPEITERVARSRSLHARVVRAVADRFARAGVAVPPPRAAFYLYPDFATWRATLALRHEVTTGAGLSSLLLERYGLGVLPASAFGDSQGSLAVRVATGLLYGDSLTTREAALAAPDPTRLPWIAASLDRLSEILADLAP